jgi:uncharacterized HAD superfamily protein
MGRSRRMKNIWDEQLKFNKRFFSDRNIDIENLSTKEKIHWAKEFYFHINKELTDLIDCLPHWKMHYPNEELNEHLISSNLYEEFIDSFKYLMGLAQALGIRWEDVEEVFKSKSEVVEQKYKQNKAFEELRNKEVVVFDIDGVINTYPQCFLEWVDQKYKKKHSTLEGMKRKIGIEQYEHFKEQYRLSGDKANQPVNNKMVSFMRFLKEKKETIVLYTTRPVNRYKRIYSDTLKWLRKRKIPFDAIYWTDYQKEDFYKLGLKIKYIVEDTYENSLLFSREGHKVYLVDSYYNKGPTNDLIVRITDPFSIGKEERVS